MSFLRRGIPLCSPLVHTCSRWTHKLAITKFGSKKQKISAHCIVYTTLLYVALCIIRVKHRERWITTEQYNDARRVRGMNQCLHSSTHVHVLHECFNYTDSIQFQQLWQIQHHQYGTKATSVACDELTWAFFTLAMTCCTSTAASVNIISISVIIIINIISISVIIIINIITIHSSSTVKHRGRSQA